MESAGTQVGLPLLLDGLHVAYLEKTYSKSTPRREKKVDLHLYLRQEQQLRDKTIRADRNSSMPMPGLGFGLRQQVQGLSLRPLVVPSETLE